MIELFYQKEISPSKYQAKKSRKLWEIEKGRERVIRRKERKEEQPTIHWNETCQTCHHLAKQRRQRFL
jgi:hypothetical protein